MSDGGKGSVQRPIANRKTFEENWDAIFGNDSNLESKLSDIGRDVLRGVVLGGSDRISKGVQHSSEDGVKDKPAK